MQKYPDKIVILKPVDTAEYNDGEYTQVYTGRCRCFLKKDTALRVGKVMDSDYQVVIPDRHMVEIGENFKVGVKMHTSKNNRTWDLVGYVTDFARYDRVCNLNFQMVKENMIYEDIPAPAVDVEKRIYGKADIDHGITLEGISVINKDLVKFAYGEPLIINNIFASDNGKLLASNIVLYRIDSEGKRRCAAIARIKDDYKLEGENIVGDNMRSRTIFSFGTSQLVLYVIGLSDNDELNTYYLRGYNNVNFDTESDRQGMYIVDKYDKETGELIEDWLYEYSFKFVE